MVMTEGPIPTMAATVLQAAPMPEAPSGSYGVYAGEEPPRRRVEIGRSPFHADVAAARAGAATVPA